MVSPPSPASLGTAACPACCQRDKNPPKTPKFQPTPTPPPVCLCEIWDGCGWQREKGGNPPSSSTPALINALINFMPPSGSPKPLSSLAGHKTLGENSESTTGRVFIPIFLIFYPFFPSLTWWDVMLRAGLVSSVLSWDFSLARRAASFTSWNFSANCRGREKSLGVPGPLL